METPEWVTRVFSYLPPAIQAPKVKAKLSIQRHTCTGCCKKTNRPGSSVSGRVDLLAEGEYGAGEKQIGPILYRFGLYARLGASVGVSFSKDTCGGVWKGGYCGTGYYEFGGIASAKDKFNTFEFGARVGLNVGVTLCYVCDGTTGPNSHCYIRMRMCGSGRFRMWYKLRLFGLLTERANEEQLNRCSPWANLITL